MSCMKTMSKDHSRRRSVIIVGGGTTGSYATPLVARLKGVSHITLIDGDIYSETNLGSQNIMPDDVGRPKVEVLAKRLRRQAPEIVIEPIFSWVEHVPQSKLRGDVVLSCVDSRRARCYVNEVCWRLGIPWIDSGVDAAGLLARTNIYRPGQGCPCMECGWNEADYAALEQVYTCQQGSGGPSATNAPASLGSIAAGLLVSECQRLLAGDLDSETDCRQVLWDFSHCKCLATRYCVNPACRFDHESWDIEPLAVTPRSMTLVQFCDLLSAAGSPPGAIRLAGQHFVNRLVCGNCGGVRNGAPCLDRVLTPKRMGCKECGERMAVSEFHATDWLNVANSLPPRSARRSLASIGFRSGDIVTVQHDKGRRYVELTEPSVEPAGGVDVTSRERCEVLTEEMGRQSK